jgi:type IV secretory pathway VirJ component
VRLVAPFGGVVAGVLLVASMLAPSAREREYGRAQAERAPVLTASASGTAMVAVMAGPSPQPDTTSAEPPPAGRTAGSAAKPIADDEAELIRRAHASLAALNVNGALTALAEHARRFPTGAHAAARERLLGDACAALRREGLPSAQCAGRR